MKFGQYSKFSFVDVETTGTSASQDRVLEVGIIRVEDGKIVGEINTLLDPESYIPPEITGITGIREEDILDAPHFSDVAEEIAELLADTVFVAHNARFDYAFIKHEFRRLGLPFNQKTLDTVRLSRLLYPSAPRHNLDALIQRLNITAENRHRAYDDAKVLLHFLQAVHEEFPAEKTEPIFQAFLKSPSLPRHISKEQIAALPEAPGVYSMYDTHGTLLYVGKSVDIRARVLSHFYNDFDSQTDLKLTAEVTRIEAQPAAGDLGASLNESSMIKTLLPIHNRALRRSREMLALMQSEKNGYYTTVIVPVGQVNPSDHHNILGVFVGKKQTEERLREIAKEYKLCLKLLGLEKGSGRCFGSQIDQCMGACVGEEESFKYNVRFVEAFSKVRVPSWPFPGAIGIREEFEGLQEVHVVYNWCYLGSLKSDADNLSQLLKAEHKFEWDNYKILRRFVKKHIKTNSIIHLKNEDQAAESFE